MREKKEKPLGDIQKNAQGSYEISNTDYGLESVTEGCDFAEGEKDKPPNCGGLQSPGLILGIILKEEFKKMAAIQQSTQKVNSENE